MAFAVLLFLTTLAPEAWGDVAKEVLNTPWWPPGTEKTAESVGILSHGLIFMTAMMEVNDTLGNTTKQELMDVGDIARAGGAGMEDLVDCVVNTPPKMAAVVRRSFEAQLPEKRPALTVVEMPGEYEFTPSSISCVASQPSRRGAAGAEALRHGDAYGVAARGLLFVQGLGGSSGRGVREETSEALGSLASLIKKAGGAGLESLLDCTAYLRQINESHTLRAALAAAGAQPALTVVEAGLEDPQQSVVLRCLAALPSQRGKPASLERFRTDKGTAVATDQHLFTSGLFAAKSDGAEALTSLAALLDKAGLSLADVVDCHFFITNTEKVFDLFATFKTVFNDEHPPPPARSEFTSRLECSPCAVQAKCIVARRRGLQQDPGLLHV